LICVEGPNDLSFLKHINKLFCEETCFFDVFADSRVAQIVLGGSTLQEWVNENYLKNLGIPEVHIYDRDEQVNGKYKYQAAVDSVNQRGDGSIAFLTSKREMENYLHIDAIKEVLEPLVNRSLAFELSDDCDVEGEIIKCLDGQKKIQRRYLKNWLNKDVASCMSLDRLKDRNAYEEVKEWFSEIIKRTGLN